MAYYICGIFIFIRCLGKHSVRYDFLTDESEGIHLNCMPRSVTDITLGGNGYSVLKEFLFSSQPMLEENTGS